MSTPGNREVAHRVFAAEFDDADLEYSESDEERAPNYVVTPSGARINRLYFVGVLTETESVNEDVLRARVVDPTGAFVVYAGQYQPDELAALEALEPPAFVAVTGKARTFQPDDSDRTFTSVRPEAITEVAAEDRDRWAVTAAEHTLDRVAVFADALSREDRGDDLRAALTADGVPAELADGVALALDHYGTNEPYLDELRTLALDVAGVVAGDREEVRGLDRAPDEPATERVDTERLRTDAPEVLTAAGSADAAATAATGDAAGDEPTTGDAPSDGTPTDDTPSEATTETATADESDAAATATAGSSEATTSASADESETTTSATTDDSETTTSASADDEDELGDFEGGSIGTETVVESDDAADAGDAGDADEGGAEADEPVANTDEMYEFDEEERQEIEEEYGTEFSTGTEVESPDEADAGDETDAPDETEADASSAAEASESAADAEADAAEADAAEAATADEGATADADDEDADAAADASPDEVLLDVMRELDDGDGADRAELVATVAERTGADEEAVEDAIQDALMGGQCYEPGDDRLKPI